MKKILLIASFLCFALLSKAQSKRIQIPFVDDSLTVEYEFEGIITKGDTIKNGSFKHNFQYSKQLYETGNYKMNKKEGLFTTYFENGNVHWLRSYKNGLLFGHEEYYSVTGELQFTGIYTLKDSIKGIYNQYFPNKKLKKQSFLYNNLPNGVEYTFSEAGDTLSMKSFELGKLNGDFWIKNLQKQFIQKGKYSQGKLTGSIHTFYDNNIVKSIGIFENGVPNGKMTDYYKNGLVKRTCFYRNDTLEGKCLTYFENGQLATDATFFKGHFDQTFLEYYPTGKLKDSINYNRSQKNGESVHFDSNGQLISKENFKNGLYDGHQWAYFSETNTIKSDFNYKNGKKVGKNYTYYPNKNIESILIFDAQDQIAIERSFYENNTLKSNTTHKYKKITDKEKQTKMAHIAKEKNYSETKHLVSLGSYIDDKKSGLWTFYTENNQKIRTENYMNDKLHGEYTEYHQNKKIKQKGKYILGNKSGVWTKFAENGDVTESAEYKNGLLDGKFTSKNNQTVETGLYKKGKKEGFWVTTENGKEIKKEKYLKGERIDK